MIVMSTELLLPFLPTLIWATMVVLSTWPLLLRAQARLGSRRTTAVAVMTIGLLLLLIGPVLFAVLVIINHAGRSSAGVDPSPTSPFCRRLNGSSGCR
jgi:predicted PurR-regulated permease PerM